MAESAIADAIAPVPASSTAGRSVRWRGREYPLVLPNRRDPRLHVAAVLLTVQVLGQTVLGFELSIAQILVALGTAAVIEVAVVFRRRHAFVWPASALLTGNGVALILRVPGTPHGDWWSLHGAWIFAATVAVSLLSKYVIRVEARPVFNPSNFGLLACFLILGSGRANPLDFWWGPRSVGLTVAVLIIVVGGLGILTRLRMLGVAVAFWVTFAVCIGIVALSGHAMTARWHLGPVTDGYYWFVLVTSPEILIFLFFMITDPKTAPYGRVARVVYAVAVAFVAALLAATQTTEFGTKVAVLGGLAAVCAIRPWCERRFPVAGSARDRLWPWLATRATRGDDAGLARRSPLVSVGVGCAVVALGGGALVVAGTPARHTRFAAPLAHRTGPVARPVVRLPAGAVPPVTVDSSAVISSRIDGATARRIARDTIADLRIQSDALRRLDTSLVATATDRAWLTKLRGRIREARADGHAVIDRFDVHRIHVATARRPFQGPPAILATLYGTVRHERYEGTPLRRTGRAAAVSMRTTFEVAWDGEHFLVVSDVLPPGFRPAA